MTRLFCLIALLSLARVALAGVDADGGPTSVLDGLRALDGASASRYGNDRFLEPDQAFRLDTVVRDPTTLIARFAIADGYYLYRDRFSFGTSTAGAQIGRVDVPRGSMKDDEEFGRVEVNTGTVEVVVPIQQRPAAAAAFDVAVGYQGCAEDAICYPPIKKTITVQLDPLPAAQAAAPTAPPGPGEPASEQDAFAGLLAKGVSIATLAKFFGLGLLLGFTPCVFPMVPILSSLIVGRGSQMTTAQAFGLSVVYVLVMAATYALAGVAAGLFGQNVQTAAQNPYVLGGFSVLFVLLALSMFGLYELQMPGGWQTRMTTISQHQSSGTWYGAAVMGFLSAIVVGPCVAAPLAGTLLYISLSGDAVLGGTALFVMALGMGTPLLVVGTSAGRLLPRAGAWMESVKKVFGFLLLGVAVSLLERILPGALTLILWALLLTVAAVFMGAFDTVGPGTSGWRRVWKGVGLAVLAYGLALVVGAAGGGSDPFAPLAQWTEPAGRAGPEGGLAFQPVKGPQGLQRELDAAKARGQAVMVDFYADWCVECKRMERNTFSDPAVQDRLAAVRLLKADVTANDAEDRALLQSLGLFGPPATLFFAADGTERRAHRLAGYVEPTRFLSHLSEAIEL